MKAAIVKKYRLIIKTMGYVGWALFWLLLWDIAVTVDFMLFLNAKINLPLMPPDAARFGAGGADQLS